METLIAVHEIQGVEVDGKVQPIQPGKPFTPNSAAQRDFLLKKGAARKAPAPEKVEDDSGKGQRDEPISKMTLDQLLAFAADKKIDLGDAKLKKEVLPIIEAAMKASESGDGQSGDGQSGDGQSGDGQSGDGQSGDDLV